MTPRPSSAASSPRRRLRPLAAAAVLLLALGAAAPPPPDPPRGEVRIVVVSDLNDAYGATEYGAEVHAAVRMIRERWRPDQVLAAGDLVAGQRPELSDARVRAMWAAFDAAVAAPLRRDGIPFGFTVGNHDASAYPAHARDRALAVAHWRDPARHPGVAFVDSAHFPLRYTFRQGDVFVLAWDASYEGTATDTAAMAWVRRQLAGPAARGARLRLALGHLPLYAVAEGRNRRGEVLLEPDSLRAVLERGGVRAYVSGHHHAYYPGRRGALELLHAGALGQGPRPLIGSRVPSPRTVTVVDLFPRDSVALTTYALDAAAPGGVRVLRTADLPPLLRGVNGHVVRRDLPDTVAAFPGPGDGGRSPGAPSPR